MNRYEYSLLGIVSELHTNITGASDCSTPAELVGYVAEIRKRLAEWTDSTGSPWGAYDEAIRMVLVAVLAKWESDGNKWMRDMVARHTAGVAE